MSRAVLFLWLACLMVTTVPGAALAFDSPLRVGWAVGNFVGEAGEKSAAILHTQTGGRWWASQLDPSMWPGFQAFDVSAVDRRTAWVALGSTLLERGVILHTADGGSRWEAQTLPDGVDAIKGIKGLSRHEAWAVSLKGVILHTTDGGDTWKRVDHSSTPIYQVNRLDVIGCRAPRRSLNQVKDQPLSNGNIWIVDEMGGNWGMIHSLYNGDLWRQEYVPDDSGSDGMHMVSAYSPRVAWAASWGNGTLYRTLDGGETWNATILVGGRNDLDDMCSPSADSVWVVQNKSGSSAGAIYHVRLRDGAPAEVREFNPAPGYVYGGLTCVDDRAALAVGFRGFTLDASEPAGVIVSTRDGGDSWASTLDRAFLWKTSFVGARR